VNFQKSGGLALSFCALLVACSGGGPKDEETVPQVRAALGFMGKEVQTIKSKGCRKASEKEISSSGTYYLCSFETTNTRGEKSLASDLVFEKFGEQWVFRGK